MTASSPPTLGSASELADLLVRVAGDDREAFSALYRATSRKLFGIVLRILKTRETAEDLLQDVYVEIWEKASRFERDRASPITWMAVIARNRAIDTLRRRQLDVVSDPPDLENVPSPQRGAPEEVEMAEGLERLESCIDTLDEPRGEAVRLAYLDGFSRKELAERFDLPLGTLKTWLYRSLKQLQDCLDE